MRTIKLLVIIFVFSIVACSQQDQTTNQSVSQYDLNEVPELMDRNTALQNGKEWETVQNIYGKNRNNLIQGKEMNKARIDLAQLYINEARVTGEHGHYYPAALKMLNEILESEKEDQDLLFRALSAKAGVQLSLHTFAEGLETAEKAVALNPYNAQIYGALVDANVELGNYEQAVLMADKMISIRPDLRSYARVSYLREIHGDVKGAIEAMELAVSAGYPGYEQTSWAQLTLGNLYSNYGYKEKAKKAYQLALEQRPDYPFAIAALAELELEKENYEAAEKLLKEACDIIPEVGFYEQLAHLYKATGKNEKVDTLTKEIFEMLADDEASGHVMNLEYAAIYIDLLGDYDKALEYTMREYNQRPDNIDVNQVLAKIYHLKGDSELAAKHLAAASKTNAQYPDLMELKGELASL